jgi:hypothetical protein
VDDNPLLYILLIDIFPVKYVCMPTADPIVTFSLDAGQGPAAVEDPIDEPFK